MQPFMKQWLDELISSSRRKERVDDIQYIVEFLDKGLHNGGFIRIGIIPDSCS